MRKLLTFILLLGSAFGQTVGTAAKPWIISNPPGSPPAQGCENGQRLAAGAFCAFHDSALPRLDGIFKNVKASVIDTGTTGPLFSGWAAADATFNNYALYSGNGNTLTGCTNTAGTTTCNFAANVPFPASHLSAVCIGGVSVSAYNACWQLSAVTYTGNFITSMSFAQGGSPAAGTGGYTAYGCGGTLRGTIATCKIAVLIFHHQNIDGGGLPGYIYSEAWANSNAPAWQASHIYKLNETVKVGTHYYHVVAPLDTDGGGKSSSSNPNNWSTACTATTSIDNTITWVDDCQNAMPEEAVVGTNYLGAGNAPPAANWAASGAIYNIDSPAGNAVGNCSPSACTTFDVASGFPLYETPFKAWQAIFDGASDDGHGNPGAVVHYAQASWCAAQCIYVRPGFMDLAEVNFFLSATVKSSSWQNLTYNQFRGIYIGNGDGAGYVDNAIKAIVTAYKAQNPSWKLDSPTNGYSACVADQKCLDYPSTVVARAKSYLPAFGYGNQGWSTLYNATEVNGSWATQNTGFILPIFDFWYPIDTATTAIKHLQFIAPSCPVNGNQAHCQAGNAGSFALFEPLGPQHHFTVVEFFAVDVMATWVSDFLYAADGCVYTTCLTSGIDFTDGQADNYQVYFNNMVNGLPSASSASAGTARDAGTARTN